jgi:ATP-dependent DNA helicase RecQ
MHADAQAYGALRLTESARPILKGENTLSFRRQVRRDHEKSALATRRRVEKAALGFVAANIESPLFSALRAWRAERAREQGVPAYVIMHDRSLHDLAARRPASRDELLGVPGIGQAKANRYGDELLKILVNTDISLHGRPREMPTGDNCHSIEEEAFYEAS